MSNTDFGFSVPQSQAPDVAPPQLPDGKYPMKLVEGQRKASKDDPSQWFIEAKFKVIAGPFADKTHIHRYFIGYKKEDTKARALADVRRLAESVGDTGPLKSMEPYLNKAFCGEIKNVPGKDADGNERPEAKLRGYANISTYSAAPAIPVGPISFSTPTSDVGAAAPSIPVGAPGAAPWGAGGAAAAAA